MSFGHCVFFTLKDASPPAQQALLDDCDHFLTGHPGLTLLSVGRRADMHRDVNVQDFDIAVITVFATKADHDAYQVSQRHQEFIERNRPNWKLVRVFDADMV